MQDIEEQYTTKLMRESYNRAIDDIIHRFDLLKDYLTAQNLTPERLDAWKEILAFLEYDLIHNMIKTD